MQYGTVPHLQQTPQLYTVCLQLQILFYYYEDNN